jgi:hypothetical protein
VTFPLDHCLLTLEAMDRFGLLRRVRAANWPPANHLSRTGGLARRFDRRIGDDQQRKTTSEWNTKDGQRAAGSGPPQCKIPFAPRTHVFSSWRLEEIGLGPGGRKWTLTDQDDGGLRNDNLLNILSLDSKSNSWIRSNGSTSQVLNHQPLLGNPVQQHIPLVKKLDESPRCV